MKGKVEQSSEDFKSLTTSKALNEKLARKEYIWSFYPK